MKAEGRGRKRSRSASVSAGGGLQRMSGSTRSKSRSASVVSVGRNEGFTKVAQKERAVKRKKLDQRDFKKSGKRGEGDRAVPDLKPKWLFAGKSGLGTNRSR